MKYPVLDQKGGRQIIDLRRSGQEYDENEFIAKRGEGQEINRAIFDGIHEKLVALKEDYPAELRQRDPEGGRFEAEACKIVHQCLKLETTILADLDFWTYLSVIELSDIVEWRHGGQGRFAALQNYGVGNRPENLFFRMWMRADIAAIPTNGNNYDLAQRGDIDLWRSHILRQRYANSRTLARALIRFQYPDETPAQAQLSINSIRKLAKRLKRLHANLVYSYLDESAAMKLIKRESLALTS
jgi:hypothetical protein